MITKNLPAVPAQLDMSDKLLSDLPVLVVTISLFMHISFCRSSSFCCSSSFPSFFFIGLFKFLLFLLIVSFHVGSALFTCFLYLVLLSLLYNLLFLIRILSTSSNSPRKDHFSPSYPRFALVHL